MNVVVQSTVADFGTIFGSQTKVNGGAADYRFNIGMGSTWRYLEKGASWRDGSGEFLLVNGRPQRQDTLALAKKPAPPLGDQAFQLIYDYSFEVTDGVRTYSIAVNDPDPALLAERPEAASEHILTFTDGVPPPRVDLTVLNPVLRQGKSTTYQDPRANIICFTPGTWIRTPVGPRMVGQLGIGDPVLTKDNGVQTIRWIGKRRMSGARFMAMPEMRPVRIRRGAFGNDTPDRDMWVSPKHRMLRSSYQADLLFNSSEVLIAAKDMVNGRDIFVDHQIKQTEYIHLLFDDHEIIWANGAETESFHPGYAVVNAIGREQLGELYQIFPELEENPHNYGQTARRSLLPHEAAVFMNH